MRPPRAGDPQAQGYIKLLRGRAGWDLLEASPDAYLLLTQIALRARRTTSPVNRHNLAIGEALIGDYKTIGLTEARYKTAKKSLDKWDLATFKGTNKGTIAKLVDSTIFDINAERSDEQNDEQIDEPETTDRRAAHERATSNKNGNKEKNGKSGEEVGEITLSPTDDEWFLSLRTQWPGINIPAEWRDFEKYCDRKNKTPSRSYFENQWLPHAEPAVRLSKPKRPCNGIPTDFPDWAKAHCPDVGIRIAWATPSIRNEWKHQRSITKKPTTSPPGS